MKATVKKVQSIETEIDIAAFSFDLKNSFCFAFMNFSSVVGL